MSKRGCERQKRVVELMGVDRKSNAPIYLNTETGRVWMMPSSDPVELTLEEAKEMIEGPTD